MINLASLSALLRTLRQAGGPDGPAAPVARVPPVVSLTPEEQPSGSGTAQVRAWSSSQARNAALLDDELLSAPAQRRDPAIARGVASSRGDHAPRNETSANGARGDVTKLELTVGGRLLQGVLRGSPVTPPMPPAIEAPAPLVATARTGAVELARGLAQSVAESGLFYESHLARWARRDYPATALGREPQASWTAASQSRPSMAGDVPTLVSEAAAGLVTRQLDALDTRALVWIGELWPGQRASVAFEEDDRRTHEDVEAGDDVAAVAWRTRIVLELPSLGRVEATLALRGSGLDLTLEAASAQARTRLAHAQSALASSLAGARTELRQFGVTVVER